MKDSWLDNDSTSLACWDSNWGTAKTDLLRKKSLSPTNPVQSQFHSSLFVVSLKYFSQTFYNPVLFFMFGVCFALLNFTTPVNKSICIHKRKYWINNDIVKLELGKKDVKSWSNFKTEKLICTCSATSSSVVIQNGWLYFLYIWYISQFLLLSENTRCDHVWVCILYDMTPCH